MAETPIIWLGRLGSREPGAPEWTADSHILGGPDLQQRVGIEQAVRSDEGGSIDLPAVQVPQQESKAPTHGVSDLAAADIGSVASYLADQLVELFAPTPPDVREAQAKAEAKAKAGREAERPAHEDIAAADERIIESAVRAVEDERAQQGEAWWKERDKGKGFERDQ